MKLDFTKYFPGMLSSISEPEVSLSVRIRKKCKSLRTTFRTFLVLTSRYRLAPI